MTNNEIRHLAEEAALHNNFAWLMLVVEEQIKELTKRIEVPERR